MRLLQTDQTVPEGMPKDSCLFLYLPQVLPMKEQHGQVYIAAKLAPH